MAAVVVVYIERCRFSTTSRQARSRTPWAVAVASRAGSCRGSCGCDDLARRPVSMLCRRVWYHHRRVSAAITSTWRRLSFAITSVRAVRCCTITIVYLVAAAGVVSFAWESDGTLAAIDLALKGVSGNVLLQVRASIGMRHMDAFLRTPETNNGSRDVHAAIV